MRRLALVAVVALLVTPCLFGGGPAQGGAPPDDGVPSGTVAFFSGGQCPTGWVLASDVQGRLVVAVSDGTQAGLMVGTPLGDQEDRTHTHTYSATVPMPPKDIAGADGPNNNGAASQTYTVAGTTDAGTTGLPFIQEQPCLKP
jgi:hypothetical protein